MKRIFTAATLLAGLCAAVGTANAAIVYTDSFESPDISGESGNPLPTGWVERLDISGTARTAQTSAFPTPFGDQVLGMFGGGSAVYEVITTASILNETILSGFSYSATVHIGKRTDRNPKVGVIRLAAVDGGGSVTVIDSTTGTPALTDFSETLDVSYVADGTYAGQRLAIILGEIAGTSGGTRHIGFDNLSVDVVPEPGSLALMGLGGLCMLRRRRS